MLKMPASRSTVSFSSKNWKELKKAKNKSKVVNLALSFYFDAQEILKKRQEEFILNELKHYQESGESYSLKDTFKDNDGSHIPKTGL